MTANPMTKLILARSGEFNIHTCDDQRCPVELTAAEFAKQIRNALPHIDPEVIGEVLIHASALYRDFAAWQRPDGIPEPSSMAAVNVLQLGGATLYGTPEAGPS